MVWNCLPCRTLLQKDPPLLFKIMWLIQTWLVSIKYVFMFSQYVHIVAAVKTCKWHTTQQTQVGVRQEWKQQLNKSCNKFRKNKYSNPVSLHGRQRKIRTNIYKNSSLKEISPTNCEYNIVVICHCIIWGKPFCHSKKVLIKKEMHKRSKWLK